MLKEIKDKSVLSAIMNEKARDECNICTPVKPRPEQAPTDPISIDHDDGADGENEEEFSELSDDNGEVQTGERAEETTEGEGSRRKRTPTQRFDAAPAKRTGRAQPKPKSEAKGKPGTTGSKRGPRGRDELGNQVRMKYAKRAAPPPTTQPLDQENGESLQKNRPARTRNCPAQHVTKRVSSSWHSSILLVCASLPSQW